MNQIYHIIIHRFSPKQGHWVQEFDLNLNSSQTVLDGIEKIWLAHDRTLVFQHACHHASCGSCGVIINGKENLPCITPLESVVNHRHTLEIEPLHNFPILVDLAVDMTRLFQPLHRIDAQIIETDQTHDRMQYSDCIECGLCLSACPVVATDSGYVGPAALAAAYQSQKYFTAISEEIQDTLAGEHGLWRCHATFECSDVCPSNVDPAGKIMALRKLQITHLLKSNPDRAI